MPPTPPTSSSSSSSPAGKKPKGLAGLAHNPKAIAVLFVVVLGAYLYLKNRSSSSSSSSTALDPNQVDPNNPLGLTYAQESADEAQGIDPNTGVPYAQENAGSSGAGGSDLGSAAAPTADQILTDQGTSVAAALQGLNQGLSDVQTNEANDQAMAQSANEAAAVAQQTANELASLGYAGPQSAGVGVSTVQAPAVGSISGGTVDLSTTNVSGGTVYQAPVTDTTINNNAPAPTPTPVAAKPPAAAPPRATSSTPTAKVVAANKSGATVGPHGVESIH